MTSAPCTTDQHTTDCTCGHTYHIQWTDIVATGLKLSRTKALVWTLNASNNCIWGPWGTVVSAALLKREVTGSISDDRWLFTPSPEKAIFACLVATEVIQDISQLYPFLPKVVRWCWVTACVTLIFLANILCVHVRKSDEMYASPTWCTHAKKKKKKKKKRDRSDRVWHLTFRSAVCIARGPPMCSPLFLPKESFHKFAVVFVNAMHFWG